MPAGVLEAAACTYSVAWKVSSRVNGSARHVVCSQYLPGPGKSSPEPCGDRVAYGDLRQSRRRCATHSELEDGANRPFAAVGS